MTVDERKAALAAVQKVLGRPVTVDDCLELGIIAEAVSPVVPRATTYRTRNLLVGAFAFDSDLPEATFVYSNASELLQGIQEALTLAREGRESLSLYQAWKDANEDDLWIRLAVVLYKHEAP